MLFNKDVIIIIKTLFKIQPAVSLRYDLKTNDVSSGLLWDYNEFVKHILEYQSVLKKRI